MSSMLLVIEDAKFAGTASPDLAVAPSCGRDADANGADTACVVPSPASAILGLTDDGIGFVIVGPIFFLFFKAAVGTKAIDVPAVPTVLKNCWLDEALLLTVRVPPPSLPLTLILLPSSFAIEDFGLLLLRATGINQLVAVLLVFFFVLGSPGTCSVLAEDLSVLEAPLSSLPPSESSLSFLDPLAAGRSPNKPPYMVVGGDDGCK